MSTIMGNVKSKSNQLKQRIDNRYRSKYKNTEIPQWVEQLSINDSIEFYIEKYDEWLSATVTKIHHSTNELKINYKLADKVESPNSALPVQYKNIDEYIHASSPYIAPTNTHCPQYEIIHYKTYAPRSIGIKPIYYRSKRTHKHYIIEAYHENRNYGSNGTLQMYNIDSNQWEYITHDIWKWYYSLEISVNPDNGDVFVWNIDSNIINIYNIERKMPSGSVRVKSWGYSNHCLQFTSDPHKELHIIASNYDNNTFHYKFKDSNLIKIDAKGIQDFDFSFLEKRVYVPFRKRFLLFKSDEIWSVDVMKYEYRKYDVKIPVKYDRFHCVLVYDFVVVLFYYNIDGLSQEYGDGVRYHRIWCLNLLTNKWVKSEQMHPALNYGFGVDEHLIKTDEDELHFYGYKRGNWPSLKPTHYKYSLTNIVPKEVFDSIDILLCGYCNQCLSNEVMVIVRNYIWMFA